MEKRGKLGRKGQVTIFIILAILIVAGIVLYFVLRDSYAVDLSRDMKPVYDYYLSCAENYARQGIDIMGQQGGYIYTDDLGFVSGSQYMPFSSQLDFFGQPVPYWMYVTGNNLLREQVPTKAGMERELARYVEENIENCDFSDFNRQGYDIFIDEAVAEVRINDRDVGVDLNNDLVIAFEGDSATVSEHEIDLDSKLGEFYELAIDTYNFEKENMFLENYAVDVMRLYAPVTGVELSCSPKVFVDENIRQDLVDGFSANFGMLKLEGDYYELQSKDSEYFVTDIGRSVRENVNFIYMSDWPTKVEIYGDRVVEPVGLQEGLGILGFCYVPYHLVYDISFPVLIQFYDGEEIFQFPVGVVIRKNQAREALPSVQGSSIDSQVCQYLNQEVEVYTYDLDLNPVEALIRFRCINDECSVGETKIENGEAVLRTEMPQCVNGVVVANAEGYATGKSIISTNEEDVVNILMKKIYNVGLDLGDVDSALIMFDGKDHDASVMYPETKEIGLVEDYYNVSVYVYQNSSLNFPEVNERKCVDVPQEGLSGAFGATEERCFDINLPATEVDFAVVGGGKTREYITTNQLENSRELNINIPLFGSPGSLEELQENYIRAEDETVYLEFE